jgi:CheY-like chemotaxis protein
MLQRDGHVVEDRDYARDLLQDLVPLSARLVVLGPALPDMDAAALVRRIRQSSVTRNVSILALLPAGEPTSRDADLRAAGANAVLRRPIDRFSLELALSRLLAVGRRVSARVAVHGQVVGTPRRNVGPHFCGTTRNVSVSGLLLASPVRLDSGTDVDLELVVPGVAPRLRGLGRVVREAGEIGWPFLGYGVEFLFLPADTQEAIMLMVAGQLAEVVPGPHPTGEPAAMAILSTLRREDWVYEIHTPVRRDGAWLAEIRRAPRLDWRPGAAGPFYVVEGSSPETAVREARAFLARHG